MSKEIKDSSVHAEEEKGEEKVVDVDPHKRIAESLKLLKMHALQ